MISGDTIAAIATAPGRSGVAIVRVSGPDAFQVAKRLAGKDSKFQASSSKFQVLNLYSPQPETPNLKPETFLDEAVVLLFRTPRSYTGEDVVEFQCHGGSVTPRRVLEACLAAGARLARRGEFTERAFLNGRIGYEQAEAVLDLIDAKTARAADAALEGLTGRRARACRALYEQVLGLSARIEHALDIDEGELPGDFVAQVKAKLKKLEDDLARAIQKATEGKILREGALVVLAGPPNAGKSSLLNALLEENRAIVSDVPGTTRDSIEAWIDLSGWPVRVVDTAGLRESTDEVEAEGVKRAEDLIAKADVVVGLGNSDGLGDLEGRLIEIHAKCDLGHGRGLNVSAKTGEGLEDLKRAIVAKLEEKVTASDPGDLTGSDVAAFHEALALLKGANQGLETEDGRCEEDLVLLANVSRSVAERLGAAIGATYSSDMLDNLFSRFCVGK